MDIHFIFTDWNKKDSVSNKDYPPNRVHTQSLKLMSVQETDAWVRNKLNQIKMYEDTDESELPKCTDEELWRKETIFKYYKNPSNRTRSTRNFKTYHEAMQYFVEQGSVGIVVEVKGQVVACKYCNAFALCSQKDKLIENGDLIL